MSNNIKEIKQPISLPTAAGFSPPRSENIRLMNLQKNITTILTSIEENIDFNNPQGRLAEKCLAILEKTIAKKVIQTLYTETEIHIAYQSGLQKTSPIARGSNLGKISLNIKKIINDIASLKRNEKTFSSPSKLESSIPDSKSTSSEQIRLTQLNQELSHILINIGRNIDFLDQAGQLAETCLVAMERSIQIITHCTFLQSDEPMIDKLRCINGLFNLGYMDGTILEILGECFQQQGESSQQLIQNATTLLFTSRIQNWLIKQAKNERSPTRFLLSLLRLPTPHAYDAAVHLLKGLVAAGDVTTHTALSQILQNKNESVKIKAGAKAALQASDKTDMKQLLQEALKTPAVTGDLLDLTLSPISQPSTTTASNNTYGSSSASSLAGGLMPTTLHTQFFSPADTKGVVKESKENCLAVDPQPLENSAPSTHPLLLLSMCGLPG